MLSKSIMLLMLCCGGYVVLDQIKQPLKETCHKGKLIRQIDESSIYVEVEDKDGKCKK